MALGLSRQYLIALREVVSFQEARNEWDSTMLVLTASPEERAEAVMKVLVNE
jgi:hypothetical protein